MRIRPLRSRVKGSLLFVVFPNDMASERFGGSVSGLAERASSIALTLRVGDFDCIPIRKNYSVFSLDSVTIPNDAIARCILPRKMKE